MSIDLNNNPIKTSSGSISITGTTSNGTGNISLNTKSGSTLILDTGNTGSIQITTSTVTSSTSNNVVFYANTANIQEQNILKFRLEV